MMHRQDAMMHLRAVREQVLAIVATLDGADPCIESVQRIQAVQTQLRQVALDLLEAHLTSCVASVAAQEYEDCRQLLAEIQAMFRWANTFSSSK